MDNQVDVSVLCLSYNHELYIKQCLDGFVMQQTTYKVEVVVHDDASQDGSARIIQDYAKKYPDLIIPVIETENQYSKKDNSIWRIVQPLLRGKYIALCEGDDCWIKSDKIQRQVDFLEEHPDYSMCFHNAFLLKTKKNMIGSRLFNDYFEDCDLTPKDALFKWVVPTASIVVRRNSIIPTQEWSVERPLADISIIFQALVAGNVRFLSFVGSIYRQVLSGGSSASANFLGVNYYDNNRRIISALSSLPNEIGAVANERLLFLEKEKRFMKLYRKSIIICFALMPVYSIKRALHRIKKIKSSWWLY